MKKKWFCRENIPWHFKKILIKMKLTIMLLTISVLSVLAVDSYSQTTKLTLNVEESTLRNILNEIESVSEFRFWYSGDIDVENKISISQNNKNITEILDEVFRDTDIKYDIFGRQIALYKDKSPQFSAMLQQPQREISGNITDSEGNPMVGVTIVVKGSTIGTITNINGNYSLIIPENSKTLVFSYVGMKTQEVDITGKTVVDIIMVPEAIGIDEVVAIGYGSLQRNRVSTAITTLDAENVTVRVASSLDRLLEGQVAGLTVQQNTGTPGGGAVMEIRGSGSIGAGDEPLVVVDGVPLISSYDKHQSPLSIINSNDIKSINILKDVSATAIYGSRGSNGVILIETKSAESGQTNVSFSAEYGVSKMMPREKLDLMNAQEYAQWRKERFYERAAYYDYEITLEDIPEEYRYPEELGEGTDWRDLLTRTAPFQKYNLSVSHGTDDFNGFFSLGYTNEQGIVIETGYQQLIMRANMEYKPLDQFKVGLKMNSSYNVWDHVSSNTSGERESYYGLGAIIVPIDGPYRDDGPWEVHDDEFFDGEWDLNITAGDEAFNMPNPVYALKNVTDEAKKNDIIFQPYLQLNPIKHLTLKSEFNLNLAHHTNEFFRPSTVALSQRVPPSVTTGSYATTRRNNWQLLNTLLYENTFGGHRISALAGYSRERYNTFNSSLSGTQFPDDKLRTINASTEQTGSTTETQWSMISYMMRLSYDYNTKYLFTGTLRRDGSSRFGYERRWGYFPSASIGWNISKEPFFPNPQWLTNLKLRTSYGMSGNNNIGNYTYQALISKNQYPFGEAVSVGAVLNDMENAVLTWEKATEFNTGLDLSLLKGKLYFVFDYYNNITENMLWNVTIPISSGYGATTLNLGKIRNKGLEFTVNSINISNNSFTWRTDFNIAFNRNKVLDLGPVEEIRSGNSITVVGQPIAMFNTYVKRIDEYGGNIPSPEQLDDYPRFADQRIAGTPIFEDINDDGVISALDQRITGNPHPDFRGGINNKFVYKNWDLNVSMSFAHNYDLFMVFMGNVLNVRGVFNVLKAVENRWKSPEDQGTPMEDCNYGVISQSFDVGQIRFNHLPHNGKVKNVSFLKVQNINIGYTFDKFKFADQIRLFCTAQNVFTFSNYKFGNPDASLYGGNTLRRNYDQHDYPIGSTILFGVNMNF